VFTPSVDPAHKPRILFRFEERLGRLTRSVKFSLGPPYLPHSTSDVDSITRHLVCWGRATTMRKVPRKPLRQPWVCNTSPRALRDERRINAMAKNRQHEGMVRNLSR
jgi:hypothetical protein